MSFLVKRGIEKDNFYEKHAKEAIEQKQKIVRKEGSKSVFSEKAEHLELLGNVTGKVSKGFVTRTKDGRIVNRLSVKDDE